MAFDRYIRRSLKGTVFSSIKRTLSAAVRARDGKWLPYSLNPKPPGQGRGLTAFWAITPTKRNLMDTAENALYMLHGTFKLSSIYQENRAEYRGPSQHNGLDIKDANPTTRA